MVSALVPDAFYWAKSPGYFNGRPTVVQVSTVFGEDPDYWTLALLGTDQHVMPGEFEIICGIERPASIPLRHAAEYLSSRKRELSADARVVVAFHDRRPHQEHVRVCRGCAFALQDHRDRAIESTSRRADVKRDGQDRSPADQGPDT